MTNDQRLVLLLPQSLKTALAQASRKERVSMAEVIRVALRKHLDPQAPVAQ